MRCAARTAIIDTSVQAGIKADQKVTLSGRDPQSAYTPVVNQMKNDNSNFSLTTMPISNAVELRSEAQLQGLSSDIVWECTTCYDNAIHDNAEVMDGTYMTLKYLPFEEAKSNPMLATYLKYVGKSTPTASPCSGGSRHSRSARPRTTRPKTQGVNGLTRADLLKSLSHLTTFDAGGMFGTTNVGQRIPTPCFLMEQFTNDKFKRLYPSKAGTFDCKVSNNVRSRTT